MTRSTLLINFRSNMTDLDEAGTQTITKEPNTNIINEAIGYNDTGVEYITEVDETTIPRNEGSRTIGQINIILPVSVLALFFAIVCFLLFLWKEYKWKTDDNNQKRDDDMAFSVRPVNILFICIL